MNMFFIGGYKMHEHKLEVPTYLHRNSILDFIKIIVNNNLSNRIVYCDYNRNASYFIYKYIPAYKKEFIIKTACTKHLQIFKKNLF